MQVNCLFVEPLSDSLHAHLSCFIFKKNIFCRRCKKILSNADENGGCIERLMFISTNAELFKSHFNYSGCDIASKTPLLFTHIS